MFISWYFVGYLFVFKNWGPKFCPEAATCFISLAHGTLAVFLASTVIFADQNQSFASINTDLKDRVLDHRVLCHYLVFYPSNLLFIGHHLATSFVFVTCRYLVGHGSYAIMVLLVLYKAQIFTSLRNCRSRSEEL